MSFSNNIGDLERGNGPYFALFYLIRVYDVVVKQLSGLPRFQKSTFEFMTILISSAQLFSDYLGKTNSDNSV